MGRQISCPVSWPPFAASELLGILKTGTGSPDLTGSICNGKGSEKTKQNKDLTVPSHLPTQELS